MGVKADPKSGKNIVSSQLLADPYAYSTTQAQDALILPELKVHLFVAHH